MLIDDRRIKVDFSQSVAKLKQKHGIGKFGNLGARLLCLSLFFSRLIQKIFLLFADLHQYQSARSGSQRSAAGGAERRPP